MRKPNLPLSGLCLCLCMLFASVSAFAQSGTTPPTNEAIKNAEVMPVMLGCEHEVALEKRKSCTNDAIMSHVIQELKYPEGLQDQKFDETVIVEFVVNTKGQVSGAKIIRGSDVFHESALEVIQTLPAFTPGIDQGKAVSVKYALPIRFSRSE